MIGKQDSYLEEQEKSRHICQQCDLVEELSNEDLENVAGGTLSNIVPGFQIGNKISRLRALSKTTW